MRVFQVWLRVFGVAVVGIALAHLLFGQSTYIGGGEVNATMESDLRFYSVLFAAYGAAFVWAAADIVGRARVIDALGLLFFLGGLARILAWAVAGAPRPLGRARRNMSAARHRHRGVVVGPVGAIVVPVSGAAGLSGTGSLP
ncbi:DUF4345 domain-containing protein [Nocardia sp. NPDC050378]|uniref:DUF4345 domain-containing protein n=1 Tax=Nocardia sp. NPDC050378 TaxID=3155400 RepID=UPI0033C977DB